MSFSFAEEGCDPNLHLLLAAATEQAGDHSYVISKL